MRNEIHTAHQGRRRMFNLCPVTKQLLKLPLPDPKLILFTDRAYYKNVEKEMATHSSILAWEITWMEETSGLYSPWGHKSRTQLSV